MTFIKIETEKMVGEYTFRNTYHANVVEYVDGLRIATTLMAAEQAMLFPGVYIEHARVSDLTGLGRPIYVPFGQYGQGLNVDTVLPPENCLKLWFYTTEYTGFHEYRYALGPNNTLDGFVIPADAARAAGLMNDAIQAIGPGILATSSGALVIGVIADLNIANRQLHNAHKPVRLP